MKYLLDANTFIQAKNDYYRFGFCPAYWHWLLQANADGKVFSVEGIQSELTDLEDELADWAGNDASHLFIPPNDATLARFAEISQWVVDQPNYQDAHREDFLAKADPLLIAHAASHAGFSVVTQETRVPANSTKVKIPNVCEAFNVSYLNTFELLEAEGARFDLAP